MRTVQSAPIYVPSTSHSEAAAPLLRAAGRRPSAEAARPPAPLRCPVMWDCSSRSASLPALAGDGHASCLRCVTPVFWSESRCVVRRGGSPWVFSVPALFRVYEQVLGLLSPCQMVTQKSGVMVVPVLWIRWICLNAEGENSLVRGFCFPPARSFPMLGQN